MIVAVSIDPTLSACTETSALIDPLPDDRFSGSSETQSNGGSDFSFSASRMSTSPAKNAWMPSASSLYEYIMVKRHAVEIIMNSCMRISKIAFG